MSPAIISTVVERWQDQLKVRVGLDDAERAQVRVALEAFCARHGITPDELVATWERYPSLTVRRRPGATEAPDLVVESFLVHNGVNVFGDIICVPGRPEDLATQGAQFVP